MAKAHDPTSMLIRKMHSPEAYPGRHSAWERRAEALLRARFGPHVEARVFDNSYGLRLLRGGPFCPPVRLEFEPGHAAPDLNEVLSVIRSSSASLECSELCLAAWDSAGGRHETCSVGLRLDEQLWFPP